MESGYLLREVVNKVNGIHFNSTEEVHTLGHLYESMLREMRDAAGDSGEFYTPRAVVRFMVAVTDPKLGEVVLDPACGTGGFLVEAYGHLEKQCKTVQDRQTLPDRKHSRRRSQAAPLHAGPNESPVARARIAEAGTGQQPCSEKITEIGDRERVDVILTNPPFGGEEERSILGGYPSDKQSAETALLFLQLIMRKLRRLPKPGRASRCRTQWNVVRRWGLCSHQRGAHKGIPPPYHRSVANGVFAPYTPIPTNLLFFDRKGPTQEIWFYELPHPEGRKGYTKTRPIQFEDFDSCIKWWDDRSENEHAWKLGFQEIRESAATKANSHWEAAKKAEENAKLHSKSVREIGSKIQQLEETAGPLFSKKQRPDVRNQIAELIRQRDEFAEAERIQRESAKIEQEAGDSLYWPIFNFDCKNPHSKTDYEQLPPEQLADDIIKKQLQVAALMTEIKNLLANRERSRTGD